MELWVITAIGCFMLLLIISQLQTFWVPSLMISHIWPMNCQVYQTNAWFCLRENCFALLLLEITIVNHLMFRYDINSIVSISQFSLISCQPPKKIDVQNIQLHRDKWFSNPQKQFHLYTRSISIIWEDFVHHYISSIYIYVCVCVPL